ncbi:MAG: biotin/lipoyl-containing protein [Gemmatimonadota bacterium]
MKYFVTVYGRTVEVELSGGEVLVDGRALRADLAAVPGTEVRHLLLDGTSHTLDAHPGASGGVWELHVDGLPVRAEVVDERTRAIRALTARTGAAAGPRPVRAPMPGLVVRVEVEEGQSVAAGQGVVIMEAMKMENELRAEADGVVARVHAVPGAAVEKGVVLVEFALPAGEEA